MDSEADLNASALVIEVMLGRHCIVATSVPSETVFSKTGQIITERRIPSAHPS